MSESLERENILYSALAIQVGFVEWNAVVAAMQNIVADKPRHVGEILVEQGKLSLEQHQRLAALVVEHVRYNDGDFAKSLDAVATNSAGRVIIENLTNRTFSHITVHPSGGSGSLEIRCPSCHAPMEIAVDTPLTDLTCPACGSHFSLVNQSQVTRVAPSLSKMGRFEVIERIGVGGFGTVWKARDKELDRTVAIKIPRQGGMTGEEQEKFFREARAAARLRHPNIVTVHEVGRDDDSVYIVSDFVRGVTLGDFLSSEKLTDVEAAQLCTKIADALQHAHENGVVHRDLKPANIMIDSAGEPHLMDFGLARREGGEVTVTVDGQVLGTPAYMSPEQAQGKSHWTDCRTDVYSLGVILFQVLTGELPFRGSAQMQIHQRLTEEPPDPRRLNRYVPRDLSIICLKCMEREPNRRYASAKELLGDLRRFIRREPILSRPISRTERVVRWAKRNPARATAAALMIFVTIASPLATLHVTHQRDLLADKVVENNRLIDRYKGETQRAASQIADLESQLEVWEGRSNPWEFWPPKRDQHPRQNMIADVLNYARGGLETQLRNRKYDSEKAARGFLALALMANAVGQRSQARNYYELARDELITLRRDHPKQPQFARALAECYSNLGRLAAKDDRIQAAKDLEEARIIFQQLATEYSSDVTHQIDWLESELLSATMVGFNSGQDYLTQVGEINRTLRERLPSEPDALYRLANYLTEQEAILASPMADLTSNTVSAIVPSSTE